MTAAQYCRHGYTPASFELFACLSLCKPFACARLKRRGPNQESSAAVGIPSSLPSLQRILAPCRLHQACRTRPEKPLVQPARATALFPPLECWRAHSSGFHEEQQTKRKSYAAATIKITPRFMWIFAGVWTDVKSGR